MPLEQMKVAGVTFDSSNNSPVVILRDMEEKRILPIWIGPFEANAILMELEGVHTSRPMTHDLIKRLVSSLGAKITQVVINNLKDNTFFAEIQVSTENMVTKIDSRPSDAIAVALRVECPIYVEEHVLARGQWLDEGNLSEEERNKRFKEFIEKLKPEDFG